MLTTLSSTLLILSGVWLQVSPELETALEAIGERRTPSVAPALAREAARVLASPDRPTDPERVDALIKIAVRGRAMRPLAAALVTMVATERGERIAIAARALAGLDAKLWLRLLRSPPQGWAKRVERLTRADDGPTARAAAQLLAPTVRPDQLRALLGAWIRDEQEDRAPALLAQAAHFPLPERAYAAIARLEFETDAAEQAQGRAIAVLAERSEKVATEVLRRARAGDSSAAIRGLTALYDRRQVSEAMRTVVGLVDPEALDDDRIVAAALEVGAALFVTELQAPARELATDAQAPAVVRRAAVAAFARLSFKDAPTIRLLTRLLKDPVVAKAAHQALEFKTGVKLRGQAEEWNRWRLSAKLPDHTPDDLDQRHQASRDLRLRFGARRVRLLRRAEARAARSSKSQRGEARPGR